MAMRRKKRFEDFAAGDRVRVVGNPSPGEVAGFFRDEDDCKWVDVRFADGKADGGYYPDSLERISVEEYIAMEKRLRH